FVRIAFERKCSKPIFPSGSLVHIPRKEEWRAGPSGFSLGRRDAPPEFRTAPRDEEDRQARDPASEWAMAEKKGGMTVQEAGRKGGERVASERGRTFYEEIGKKGGQTVARERGHGFYEEIGKKGGEAVKATRGHDFYSEIGHKGGQRV